MTIQPPNPPRGKPENFTPFIKAEESKASQFQKVGLQHWALDAPKKQKFSVVKLLKDISSARYSLPQFVVAALMAVVAVRATR